MRKIVRLLVLSLFLTLGMAACDGANISAQPTTTAPSSLIPPTTLAITNLATPAISIPPSAQPITTTVSSTVAPIDGLPEVETDLGPLPTNCPVSQLTYKELDSRFAPGTAGPGLWAVGLQNKIQISRDQLAQQYIKKYGWAIKVLWVVEAGQKEPITLTGYNRADNQPVWFSIDKESTSPVFSANPAISGYDGHPSNVFFAKAGCYDLVAKWNGGGWKITVAVGHQ